jgi:hypothetical protein
MALKGNRFEALAVLLAGGEDVKAAAPKVGLSERQAHRYTRRPDFRARVDAIRGELVERAMGELVASLTAATATLKKLAESAESEQVRLAASKSIIEGAARMRESVELERRVRELEAAAGRPGPAVRGEAA